MTELIQTQGKTLEHLPLLPLRDVVVFPHMVIPLFVGRPKSIKALERAMENGGRLVLATQKDAAKDDPGPDDIFTLGCIAHVLQMLKLPDGTVKVLIEGRQRARFARILEEGDTFVALAEPLETQTGDARETEALRRSLLSAFEEYVKLNQKLPQELVASLAALEDPEHLTDIIAAHLPLKLDKKQELLEILALVPRMERLLALLEAEIDILEVEKRIRSRVKRQMENRSASSTSTSRSRPSRRNSAKATNRPSSKSSRRRSRPPACPRRCRKRPRPNSRSCV